MAYVKIPFPFWNDYDFNGFDFVKCHEFLVLVIKANKKGAISCAVIYLLAFVLRFRGDDQGFRIFSVT
jgi:hypothetical protein